MVLRGVRPGEGLPADFPLREFSVEWMNITERQVQKLKDCISSATNEEQLQRFLNMNPMFLIRHLAGGHGRWVIPKQRLGSEFVTDFVIGEKSSSGFDWQAVELESPEARMFTKSGNPSQHLTHAIRQIHDWRSWLKRNQSYASAPREKNGLGLEDINCNLPGVILIGRRHDIELATNERRRQMAEELNIRIHSYDFLTNVS